MFTYEFSNVHYQDVYHLLCLKHYKQKGKNKFSENYVSEVSEHL